MKKGSILLITLAALSFFSCSWVKAVSDAPSKIELSIYDKELAPGSYFQVRVLVSSDKPINALDLELGYSPRVFEIKNIDTSFSIIPIWKEVSGSAGIVRLVGGRTSPFVGEGGEVATLNVYAAVAGNGSFSVRKAKLYAADGTGAEFEPDFEIASINISKDAQLKTVLDSGPVRKQPLDVFEITKDPLTMRNLLISKERRNNAEYQSSLYFREKRWFLWSDWKPVATLPLELSGGTWIVEIQNKSEEGIIPGINNKIFLWDIAIKKFSMAVLILVISLWFYIKFLLRVVI